MASGRIGSRLPGIAWPAPLSGFAAELVALQYQYEQSQWWPPDALRAQQFRQLRPLIAQAAKVPFHAARLAAAGLLGDGAVTEAAWARLPVLTRRDLQREGVALHAPDYPEEFGPAAEKASGGSTGQPVRVRKTALDALFWNASQIRAEVWHREKPGGHIARIRNLRLPLTPAQRAAAESPDGLTLENWGPPSNQLWQTGPLTMIDETRPVAEQAAFLQRLRPDYLYTPPSNLRLLLGHCRHAGLAMPPLLAVWTLSEVVDEELRALCREVFGARIVHDYTAGETGYMALQCPEHDHFHVMAETHLLEVLDAAGRPCAPGETGRVVVTPLHNFAMPLLRYEIGDEAVVGPPCPCGRGLPVLRQVIGRTLDLLTLPDGRRRRTDLRHYHLSRIRPILEFQVVQRTIDTIELSIVVARPLTPEEEAAVMGVARTEFGPDFHIMLAYPKAIARTPAGKLRPFLSLLPAE